MNTNLNYDIPEEESKKIIQDAFNEVKQQEESPYQLDYQITPTDTFHVPDRVIQEELQEDGTLSQDNDPPLTEFDQLPQEEAEEIQEDLYPYGEEDEEAENEKYNAFINPAEDIPDEDPEAYEDPSIRKESDGTGAFKGIPETKVTNAMVKRLKEEALTPEQLAVMGNPTTKALDKSYYGKQSKSLWDKMIESYKEKKAKKQEEKNLKEVNDIINQHIELDPRVVRDEMKFKPLQYERKIYNNGRTVVLPKGTMISPDGTKFYNEYTNKIEELRDEPKITEKPKEEKKERKDHPTVKEVGNTISDALTEKTGVNLWDTVIKGI